MSHRDKDSHDRAPGALLAELAAAAPLVLVGLVLLVSVWWDGAFDLRYWAPLSLLALALLLALTLAGTLSLPTRGAAAVAVAAIWGLAAFALLSAVWAESPADAWEGGARTVLYAALFTLALAAPGGAAVRRWVGAGLVLGVVAIGLATEVRVLAGETGTFLAGRLNDPIGYRNGTAALFSFAVWPLIGYAARRGHPTGARAAVLAAVVLLAGLAFLTQSRGMLLGLAAGGLVSLAIGPDRVRRSWLAIAVVAVIAAGADALLSPYHASGEGSGAAGATEIADAGVTLLLLCAASFALSLFAFVFDNGLRAGRESGALRAGAAAGLAALALLAAAVAIAKVGNPVSYGEDKWDEFSAVEAGSATGTRLGTVSGPRYDIWRVAVEQFAEQPLAGAGEGSYSFAYYRERRTDRNLVDAHSLPLRLLAETGLIGAGLLVLWLAATAVAIAGRARRAGPGARTWVAGLAAAGAVVVAQSGVDWLWLIPALFGLAVLALGLAASDEEDPGPAPLGLPGRALAAGALGLAILSAAALFFSGIYVRKARSEAATSPAASLSAARTAERLNPLAVTPLYLQAAALESQGDVAGARDALREALDREQDNFVTLALLGDLEVRAGNDAVARRYYRRALALNPLDTGLVELSRGAGGR